VLRAPEIRAALWLSLWTTMVTVIIGLVFAIPMGYALSRYRFPGHAVVDSIVDLPIILPPLVVGLSLLVFFQTAAGRWIEDVGMEFVFQRKGIILCQLLVSASFGIRAIKLTFDGIDPRIEHVAMTLGCTRAGAFFRVALPMARRGIIVGAILIWTRAFGIFGPLIVFVGAVRFRTEVLPTTIYLEQSVGRIEVALAVTILMLALATVALVAVRILGLGER
jgi:molybdate transport system permease protein